VEGILGQLAKDGDLVFNVSTQALRSARTGAIEGMLRDRMLRDRMRTEICAPSFSSSSLPARGMAYRLSSRTVTCHRPVST
jgi:hypothetical protein